MRGAFLTVESESPHEYEGGLSKPLQEVIVGAAKLGAFGGTFLGGALMLHYGRRLAIGLDGAFFVLGPLLMAASESPTCALSFSPDP